MGIPVPAFVPYPYFFSGPICLPVEIPLACAKHYAVHSSNLGVGRNEWAIFGI